MTTIFQKRLGWSITFFQSCKWWYRDHCITKPIDLHCLNPQKWVILTIPHSWWFRNQVNAPVHVGSFMFYPMIYKVLSVHRCSLSHYLQGFTTISVVFSLDFRTNPTPPTHPGDIHPPRVRGLQTLQGLTQFTLQGPTPGAEPGGFTGVVSPPYRKWEIQKKPLFVVNE